MLESARIVAPTPNSAIVQPNVDDNFAINSTQLNMIQENKFNGHLWADPHDYIREFLAICNMFRYGETQSEAIKLLIFPFSLCDKVKTWFNELNEEFITSWEQMRKAFINKFFPPSLFNRLLLEIRNFSQLVCKSLTEAWLRLKNMLRKCHGHGLTKGAIIQIFYHDDKCTDISEITRKLSKSSKHGYENGRVNKSRKPKPEKVESTLKQMARRTIHCSSSLPFYQAVKIKGLSTIEGYGGSCTRGKAQVSSIFTLNALTQLAQAVTSKNDSLAIRVSVHLIQRLKLKDPMIGGFKGVYQKERAELKGLASLGCYK
ncbi:reverse transcriptase domain-containing protein [Tanacetum coccineum]